MADLQEQRAYINERLRRLDYYFTKVKDAHVRHVIVKEIRELETVDKYLRHAIRTHPDHSYEGL